jgi:hypothetical protein
LRNARQRRTPSSGRAILSNSRFLRDGDLIDDGCGRQNRSSKFDAFRRCDILATGCDAAWNHPAGAEPLSAGTRSSGASTSESLFTLRAAGYDCLSGVRRPGLQSLLGSLRRFRIACSSVHRLCADRQAPTTHIPLTWRSDIPRRRADPRHHDRKLERLGVLEVGMVGSVGGGGLALPSCNRARARSTRIRAGSAPSRATARPAIAPQGVGAPICLRNASACST